MINYYKQLDGPTKNQAKKQKKRSYFYPLSIFLLRYLHAVHARGEWRSERAVAGGEQAPGREPIDRPIAAWLFR